MVYLPTCTIEIHHSCRWICQSHGSYGRCVFHSPLQILKGTKYCFSFLPPIKSQRSCGTLPGKNQPTGIPWGICTNTGIFQRGAESMIRVPIYHSLGFFSAPFGICGYIFTIKEQLYSCKLYKYTSLMDPFCGNYNNYSSPGLETSSKTI